MYLGHKRVSLTINKCCSYNFSEYKQQHYTYNTFINKIPLSLQTHNNLFQNSFPKHLCSKNRKIISQHVCLSRHHLHFQHLNHSSPALNIVCVVVVVYFFVAAHLSTLRWRLIGNFAFGPKLLPSLRLRC